MGCGCLHGWSMPVKGALERYLVKPGQQVTFTSRDTRERVLAPGDEKETYEDQIRKLQDQLQELQKKLYAQNRHRILLVLQAMDTGGKDGCIKHVFSHIDPQGIRVHSFKRPSDLELAHDFLWRVHAQVPARGQMVIFNRSHYEDIVAVRVKKIYETAVWKRRVRHVIDFERMLVEEGTTLVKIFLHISKEEQKERLQARLDHPEKHWKFNPEDLADRRRWSQFMHAYSDVIEATTTRTAPWYIVPADRKWYRNLCVARIMVDTMKKLDLRLPKVDWDPGSIVIE